MKAKLDLLAQSTLRACIWSTSDALLVLMSGSSGRYLAVNTNVAATVVTVDALAGIVLQTVETGEGRRGRGLLWISLVEA